MEGRKGRVKETEAGGAAEGTATGKTQLTGAGDDVSDEPALKEVQAFVCGIFREVFQLDRPVLLQDDFFALGGDSIRGMQILSAVHREGYTPHPSAIFLYPVAEEFAAVLWKTGKSSDDPADTESLPGRGEEDERKTGIRESLTQEEREAVIRMMPWEEVEAVYPFLPGLKNRFRVFGDRNWFSANLLFLYQEPDMESWKKRCRELVRKRQMLRSLPVFPPRGEPFTVVRKAWEEDPFILDISWMKNAKRQRQHLRSFVRAFREEGFAEGTPAFRAGLVRIGPGRCMILLLYSHYILDADGVKCVAEDLAGSHTLTDDASQVGSFHHRYALITGSSETGTYWDAYLEGVDGYTVLPFLAGHGTDEEMQMKNIRTGIGLEPLQAYGRKHHVTLAALVHAALGDALLSLTGFEKVCFISTGSGRNEFLTDDERLTGMFVVETPFVYRKNDTPEICRDALLGHRQYNMFDFISLGERFTGNGTLPQVVRCNVISSQIVSGAVPDQYFLDSYEDGYEDRYRGLEIFFITADRLYLNMTYNSRFISGEGANRLKERFLMSLGTMIESR